MANTPATPGNPFREGAEQSVDAQKIALTKMLAEQGAVGSQILSNRAQDAAALSAASGQQANPLYQTFERDAAQARQFQQSEAARIAAANQAYLDQVRAALPIHARDTDAYYEALRKEYEDRQRQREMQERLQRAQLAAAAASRSAAVKRPTGALSEATPSQKMSWEQALKVVGNKSDPQALLRGHSYKKMAPLVNDIIADAVANNWSWDQVLLATRSATSNPETLMAYGWNPNVKAPWDSIIQPLLLMESYRWGVPPESWVKAGNYGAAPKPAPKQVNTPGGDRPISVRRR